MAKLLALEWDGREARIAVARTRGKEAVLEHAFAVDLAPRDGGEGAAEVNVGERIAAALAARRIGRCETLVAVGRTSIELRRLSLPPAPPEELPDMVRFQAMRDFAGLGEDWPLDFVPLDDAPADNAGASASVLAAVIAPKLVAQIRQTCEAAGLEMERLVLRPFAAASLLRRARPSEECRMLVDLLSEEADLTVLIGGTVAFVRTVRLPAAEEEVQMRALLGEARRTIAAAQNQLGGRRVERLVLCGEQSRLAPVEAIVAEQLSLPVESFDPFSAAETDGELRDELPDHSGRFAPLVGMLVDEAAQARPDIDFLDPRRRPTPPSKRRQHVLIAATAAAVVLLGVFLIWMKQSSDDQKIRSLQAESNTLDKKIADEARIRLAKVDDIEEFTRSDITWLDELKTASERLPPGEHILVSQLSAIANPDGGGQLILNGYAQEAAHTSQMVQNLNDGVREASGKGAQENNQRSDYPWRFDNLTVRIPPPEDEPADAE
jgi:Tfp pilus assembly PilM family ATPase